MVETYIGVNGMGVAPAVGITELAVRSAVVPLVARMLKIRDPLSRHRRGEMRIGTSPSVAEHSESVEIEIIAVRKMICRTKAQEEIVSVIPPRSFGAYERTVIEDAVHPGSARVVAHAESDAGVCIPSGGIPVDVCRHISASARVGRDLGASEIPSLRSFLSTMLMIPAVPSGLYLAEGFVITSIFSILSRNLLQNLRAVVGSKAGVLSIDPYSD